MKYKFNVYYSQEKNTKTIKEIIEQEHWKLVKKELFKHSFEDREKIIDYILKDNRKNKSNT